MTTKIRAVHFLLSGDRLGLRFGSARLVRRRRLLSVAIVALAALVVGCGGSTPTASPAPPSPAPSEPSGGEIEHRTGATDLILREEVGGGFVPMWFFATQAPFFSLYGDGTVVYRDESAPLPEPGADGIVRAQPFRRAQLTEEQVQELLRFALTEGGLATALPHYDNPGVADAPTTIFQIRAGGVDKTVEVYALGLEAGGQVDPARRAFVRLDERLRGLTSGGALGGSVWTPDRWRGVLIEAGGVGEPRAWPWRDFAPADFRPATDDVPMPHRTLASAEVAALGLDGIEGGFHGLLLAGPNGVTYTFGLRPLLPDETE